MLRTTHHGERTGRGSHPVAAVLDHLAGTDGRPDLSALAAAVTGALVSLPGVARLAVAVDPDRAVLLDTNWTRHEETCLVAGDADESRWAALPTGWNPLAAAVGGRDELVFTGTGELPGGAPWNDDDPAGAWFLAPVRVLGHTVACVLARSVPLSDGAEIEARLEAISRALGVVAGLWAETVSLGAGLDQARSELESLTRLNRLQGRFVAMTSHELKTPLTSITAYTDVLRGELNDDAFPHAREFLDVIKAEADRLLRMVNRILDFTRVEYGSKMLNRTAVDLRPLVDETVRGLQPTIGDKDLDVSVEAPVDLPDAMVDADLIRQVLINLVGNAVKFTPRGGEIRIRVRELESAVSVSVADTGPGIPAEDIRRVFREYYRADGKTAREEGSGLGLTIARHIVQLHGGHIEVRRRDAGGADFRFLVPKETGTVDVLPLPLGPKADPAEVRTLVDELLRLVGELSGSRGVAILMRDGHGALAPLGVMGGTGPVTPLIENQAWTAFLHGGQPAIDPAGLKVELGWDDAGVSERMFAPLGTGYAGNGVVITGRRREGSYGLADLVQLGVLAEVVQGALQGANVCTGTVIEAVRTLLALRRTGVPTATPAALDLLARLAAPLGIGTAAVRRIQYAATLHDAGMARIEEEIVYGETGLSVDQRDEVENHVEQGMDLLRPLLPDEATAQVIRHHHEKYDGSGYPDGLAGDAIPAGARLLAVVDAWFSLTRNRPFRDGLAPEAAMVEIENHAGTQFDPKVTAELRRQLTTDGTLAATAADPATK